MSALDEPLDIFGQNPLIGIYTQITLCYSVPDPAVHTAIIDKLNKGLERLAASFPWIAGQIICEGASENSSGVFKIKPFESIPRLVVKHLHDDQSAPTMASYRQASFPFSMLDESIVAPRNTFPGGPGETPADPAPVFLLQATFITGGLLLTFVAAHNAMDMAGQGQMIHLLSNACRGEPFSREALSYGNLPRGNLIPQLNDFKKSGPDSAPKGSESTANQPPETTDTSTDPEPVKCTWAYFSFEPSSLAALKSLAAESVDTGYITTDDALTALIWQSILRARVPRLDSATAKSTLGRAVDARRYINVPLAYPGDVTSMAYTEYTVQKLVEEPTGKVAIQLRAAVDPEKSTLAYDTLVIATSLYQEADKKNISVTRNLDLSVGLMISSWTKPDCYHLDFDLGLGTPEAVRRPQFPPVESLIYYMPKRQDGEIAVGLCLREADMERLKADKGFARYARFIG